MPIQLVLEIIRLSLEIINKVIDNIPAAQQAAAWERHEARMQLFIGLLPHHTEPPT